ncbi:hypothetical protein H2200_013050 [Cladophialophora chaetospira]|uniref:Uncharacterized protein n=1 Tax=Cladophialophora chaetospira TaxID=386627 RepID=A0AA38WWR3_9EURO|nr:hypothetical protein H2200_013050 [Cladophialophora chaetospira]
MDQRYDFPGVATVTGAASGIGQATAIAFARSGCRKIALLDRDESGLAETRTQILAITKTNQRPCEVEVIPFDVTSAESVASAYSSIRQKFGRIDYAVQCAGIVVFGSSTETSIEDFDKAISVNYRGLWLCTRQILQVMTDQTLDAEAFPDANIPSARAQRGSIVNLSSDLAYNAQPNTVAYIGSKGAVTALTRADAMDFVGQKIRVNCVLPGIVDSPMTKPTPEVREWLENNAVRETPAKRFGLPEEIADVAVFLASNKASFVTGANWAVDGGRLAGHC